MLYWIVTDEVIKMNEIIARKGNRYIWKPSSDVKKDYYLLAIVLHWIVTDDVIKMNEIIKKGNRYICKPSSDVKLD